MIVRDECKWEMSLTRPSDLYWLHITFNHPLFKSEVVLDMEVCSYWLYKQNLVTIKRVSSNDEDYRLVYEAINDFLEIN